MANGPEIKDAFDGALDGGQLKEGKIDSCSRDVDHNLTKHLFLLVFVWPHVVLVFDPLLPHRLKVLLDQQLILSSLSRQRRLSSLCVAWEISLRLF